MRILVSNDDGYFSPGIAALVRAASGFGSVTVVAPEQNRSGASNSLTLDRPLSVLTAPSGFQYVNGTPTDCVHIALTGLIDAKPDLVLSGINNGPNMGDDTIYSGTVAAAMEGYLFGIPSIAFSLSAKEDTHLDSAERVVADVLQRFLSQDKVELPLLNVNIPSMAYTDIRGLRATRLGKRHESEPVHKMPSPRGGTVYWIGPAGSARDAGPGTDFDAVANGFVSITPLQIDLTNTTQLAGVADWSS